MGYQESYISTKNNADLEKILDMFRKYDVRCKDDLCASCVARITLEKDIEGFKKGKEFLYLSGERSAQRGNWNLFDIESFEEYNKFTPKEQKIINDIDIIFTEGMPSKQIFRENSSYATVKDLDVTAIEPNSKYMNIAREFFEKSCAKNDGEIDFVYDVNSEEEFDMLKKNLYSACDEMGFNIYLSIEPSEYLPVDEHIFNVENLLRFTYNETPQLDKLGDWWQPHGEQRVRAFARALENRDK